MSSFCSSNMDLVAPSFNGTDSEVWEEVKDKMHLQDPEKTIDELKEKFSKENLEKACLSLFNKYMEAVTQEQ